MTSEETYAARERHAAKLRDLALILLGAASVKTERQRVVDSVPPGLLCAEVGKIFEGLRTSNVAAFQEWLTERGAPVANGTDVVAAVLDALKRERTRQYARSVVAELGCAAHVEDAAELAKRLRAALAKIEEFAT